MLPAEEKFMDVKLILNCKCEGLPFERFFVSSSGGESIGLCRRDYLDALFAI